MSVLIKGIEMPIGCSDCPCANDEVRFCRAAKEYIPMIGKPKFCPLVEVPTPHGKLIDADELYKETAEWEAQALHGVNTYDRESEDWYKWTYILNERSAFKFDVADAPTVIESEK